MAIYSTLPDNNSTTIFITNAIKDITGYSANEFYKKPLWTNIIFNEDKEEVWKGIKKHRKDKIPLKLTYRIVTKSGDIKWVKDEASPILDGNKNIIRIDGFIEDITELKEARSQIKYQSELVDKVSNAIISTDANFVIKSWNKAAEEIYGYRTNEVIGKKMFQLVNIRFIKNERKHVLDYFFKKGYWKGETLQKRKDGKWINIYSSVICVKDNDDNFLGAIAINMDITKLKKSEQKIEELSRFPSANPSPVLRIDKKGNILYSNKSGKKLIESWREKNKKYLPGVIRKSIKETLESKKNKQIELDQQDRTYLFSVVPIRGEDYVNIYGMDISNEIKLRKTLNKAKSDLEIKVKKRTAELEKLNKRLQKENQKHIQTLQSLKLEESRLNALFRLSQISEAPLDKITKITLEQTIKLTQSKIGFIGLLNEDETVYTLHSVSKNVVKDCRVTGDPIHWPVSKAGIWADAVRERKTVFINEYSKPHPKKKGIPKGHLSLQRFMVVPIFDDKKIVAVAGVANKDKYYNKTDERQTVLLLESMWGYVQKYQKRLKLQKAYDKLEDKVKQRTAELEASTNALKESEERYRLAQRAAGIGCWDWNIKTGNVEWSDQIEPMFGFDKGKFGKTYEAFLDCIHPDDSQFVIDSIDTCFVKNLGYDIEHRIIWPDGSIHWVRETGDVIRDNNGKPVRMVGIVQEITDRKKNEEQIKKLNESLWNYATRLEAANKEIEAFSYSISHDLRAPLRSIDGFSQILLEDYSDKLDDNAIDYLNRVRNASQRMGQLIDGMLQLSRLSRKEMHVEKVDMGQLATSIIDKIRKEDPSRNVEVKIEDNLVIEGDKNLLQILLENLLGNAWKFTSKQKNAKIEFGKIKKKNDIVFFIKDNGAGFDENYIDKLFIPFQRLHDHEFPGDGIGLGIVSRIIRRHGGQIWAEGEVEKGAIFYFKLGEIKHE